VQELISDTQNMGLRSILSGLSELVASYICCGRHRLFAVDLGDKPQTGPYDPRGRLCNVHSLPTGASYYVSDRWILHDDEIRHTPVGEPVDPENRIEDPCCLAMSSVTPMDMSAIVSDCSSYLKYANGRPSPTKMLTR